MEYIVNQLNNFIYCERTNFVYYREGRNAGKESISICAFQ